MLNTEFEPYISMVLNMLLNIELEPYVNMLSDMLSNIEPEPYINTIIALLGVAYPILLQVIAVFEERYESENIKNLFEKEWEWKAFQGTLVASLLLVGIWSLKLSPQIEIEGFNCVIENSAVILVAVTATLLVISFFRFVRKVFIYYTSHRLTTYLINRYRQSNNKTKYFSALSDLLLLSIKKQRTKLSRTLSDFFYTAFRNIRDKRGNKPVVYDDMYYRTVYRAIEALAILKGKQYYNLEHNTSGARWLLGSTKGKEIHERTYTWLWRNICLAIRYQRDDLIMLHWGTCYQYYYGYLRPIPKGCETSSESIQISSQKSINKPDAARERFIEFHYALGGLLIHKKRYHCVHRIFNYTQSNSSSSVLLPKSMDEIFNFFIEVSDPYDRKYRWFPEKYPFHDLEGMNSHYGVKQSIMSYMAILFLRQYRFRVNFPSIPSTQVEIRQWIEGLNILKELVNEHLKNEPLLKTLKLDFITPEWCKENKKPFPTAFIDDFKKQLEDKYDTNASTLPIAEDKVSRFKESSKTKIEATITQLQRIHTTLPIEDNDSDRWYVNGQRMLHRRDAFSENPEVHYMDYDSFLASVLSEKLEDGLSETFYNKKTRSYLLQWEDLFKGVDKLSIDDRYVIVNFGVPLDSYINDLQISGLSQGKYKNIDLYSYNGSESERVSEIVGASLFILKKSDLPGITTKPIPEEIITKYELDKISDSIDLYASVIDLNTADELKKSVLLNIIIHTEFTWKKNIEIVQLKQYWEYNQNGIVNKLEDIRPF